MATHDITQATFKVKSVIRKLEWVMRLFHLVKQLQIYDVYHWEGENSITERYKQGLNKGPNILCCCIKTPFSIM